MIYNPKKIQELINSVEAHMTEEEQKAIRIILANYNKIYVLAKEKVHELDRRQEQFVRESLQNEKLRVKLADKEMECTRLKSQNKEQRELLKIYRKK